jgi:hypothetical protein
MAKWTPSPNFLPGDTEMGSGLADSHQFTGSVTITGSLAVNGVNITGGGGGSGDVTGPGAATDNAIARYDLTTGKIIQNSGVTIDDSNNITGIVDLASTGNTTLGNTSTDYHQVSGTLDVSGSTILGRNKFGDIHQVTGALDIRVDGSSFLTPGAMRLISDDVYSFFRILNSTDQSDNGGLTIGLNGANAFIQTESGQNGTLQIGTNNGTQLTMTNAGIATYSNNFTIQGNTTLGDNSTDYHQVSGTLHVSGGIIQQQYFSASISTPVNATCSLYNVFNYHLTANSEVTASSPVAGTSYLFFFRQDGTGTRTVSFSGFKWPGGTAPTLSTAAGAVDIVSGISDGTYIYADTTKAFS